MVSGRDDSACLGAPQRWEAPRANRHWRKYEASCEQHHDSPVRDGIDRGTLTFVRGLNRDEIGHCLPTWRPDAISRIASRCQEIWDLAAPLTSQSSHPQLQSWIRQA